MQKYVNDPYYHITLNILFFFGPGLLSKAICFLKKNDTLHLHIVSQFYSKKTKCVKTTYFSFKF